MKRPVIAVDLDDTLSATTDAIIAYASVHLGKHMERGDITSSQYWGAYGLSDEKAIALVHGYNLAGFPDLRPLPDALPILQQLSKNCELHIITSRDLVSEEVTHAWLDRHFPAIFSSVSLVGNKFVSSSIKSKGLTSAGTGAVALIDDSLSHLLECSSYGMKPLFFGNYPWQPTAKLPSNILRTPDWEAVGRYFNV